MKTTSDRPIAGPAIAPRPVDPASSDPSGFAFRNYTPIAANFNRHRESIASVESLLQASDPLPARPLQTCLTASQAHKRAYRQRRKDPSCDACRERKVKCDATLTTGCSECSTRTVKCEFTRDTNRRLSSIKLIQDLKRQLDRVRRENSELREIAKISDVDVKISFVTSPPPLPCGGGGDGDNADNAGDDGNCGVVTSGEAGSIGGVDSSEVYGSGGGVGTVEAAYKSREIDADANFNQANRARRRGRSLTQFLPNISQVRSLMQTHARGLWKAPIAYRSRPGKPRWPALGGMALRPWNGLSHAGQMELPPRQLVDQLLRSYHASFHATFPFLHWRTLSADVDELYTVGASKVSPSWLSLLYAVLAVGSLFSLHRQPYGNQTRKMVEASIGLTDPWNNDFELNDVRTMALLSVCLAEMNLRSTAWAWLGRAIRMAQDMGLEDISSWQVGSRDNTEQHKRTAIDAELGRRVWWTMYVLDRGLASELGRAILPDGCGDLEEFQPLPLDDGSLSSWTSTTMFISADTWELPRPESMLAAVLGVARCYATLDEVLRAPVVASSTLSSLDEQLLLRLQRFPHSCDPRSLAPLSVSLLPALAYGLHARLLLHRHNLSPASPPATRSAAIQQCVHVAADTALLLNRAMPSSSLANVATSLLTMHIFRCSLFLLLAGCFDYALTCVHALASLNDHRDVAVPCGRFLTFFVSTLTQKRIEHGARSAQSSCSSPSPSSSISSPPSVTLNFTSTFFIASPLCASSSAPLQAQQGHGSPQLQDALVHDEELLAYASADLQVSEDKGWLWSSSDGPVLENHRTGVSSVSTTESLLKDCSGHPADETLDWGGWTNLEASVRTLTTCGALPKNTSASWTPRAMEAPTARAESECKRMSGRGRISIASINNVT